MAETENQDVLLKSILYRAHYRGSKEADTILGGFAKAQASALTQEEKDDFATLLTHDDGLIFKWLDGAALGPQQTTLATGESLRHKIKQFRDGMGHTKSV